MSNDLMVYLKTTDTCQLNCNHCFTNGSNGKKGFFDPKTTIDFFRRLRHLNVYSGKGNISLHGGEPLLCPNDIIFEAYDGIKEIFPDMWWSMQTNLTYKITDDKYEVFDKICEKSWGTSWDYQIRWPNPKQEQLWRTNVKNMADAGHDITVMVSLSGSVIKNKEPIEIIDDMASLGVKHINFERVTANGNAIQFIKDGIMPPNRELDQWFHRMWKQTLEHQTWKYIDNMFLDSVLSSFVYQTYSGCRSRSCEQKILTINADGTVGGCPNGAVEKTYGSISDDVASLLYSPNRLCNITSEASRNNPCSTCEVFDICNGDCYQLSWEDDICAAPKSLMKDLKLNSQRDLGLYKEVLNGFMGQE